MWINCRWSGNGEAGGPGLVEFGFEDTKYQFKKHLQLFEGWLQNVWNSSQELHTMVTGTNSGLGASSWTSGEISSQKK